MKNGQDIAAKMFKILYHIILAELLNNLSSERESNFSRELKPVIKNEIFDDSENIVINASLFDLARVFKTAIDNMPVVSQFELSREPVKLEEQKDFIFKHFDGDGKLKFSIILNKLDTRMKIVVTFLAVLDLVREGLCSIDQEKVLGLFLFGILNPYHFVDPSF